MWSANGGTPKYSLWYKGEEVQGGGSGQWTMGKLGAGDYPVRLVDSMGCSLVDTLRLKQPAAPTIEYEHSEYGKYETLCYNDSSGWIRPVFEGNASQYRFIWKRNGEVVSQGSQLQGARAGKYQLTLINMNGCQYKTDVQLKAPPRLKVYRQNKFRLNRMTVDKLVAKGGVGKYTLYKDGEEIHRKTLVSRIPKSHEIRVIDENGCESKTVIKLRKTRRYKPTKSKYKCSDSFISRVLGL